MNHTCTYSEIGNILEPKLKEFSCHKVCRTTSRCSHWIPVFVSLYLYELLWLCLALGVFSSIFCTFLLRVASLLPFRLCILDSFFYAPISMRNIRCNVCTMYCVCRPLLLCSMYVLCKLACEQRSFFLLFLYFIIFCFYCEFIVGIFQSFQSVEKNFAITTNITADIQFIVIVSFILFNLFFFPFILACFFSHLLLVFSQYLSRHTCAIPHQFTMENSLCAYKIIIYFNIIFFCRSFFARSLLRAA